MLKECLCFQLGNLSKYISKHYREKIVQFDLTHAQFFMLMAIIEFEGYTQTQLADHTSSDRTTTTGLIDRLERDGWVERHSDPEDRRILRIFLSPKGKKHRKKLQNIFFEVNDAFQDRFSLVEWNQFQEFLNKLSA